MQDSECQAIAAWVTERGLAGAAETELLQGFCERCQEAGLPLTRGIAVLDTLHPIHEGRAFRWRSDGIEESAMIEYGSTGQGEAAASWQRSVFHHLLTGDGAELRRCFAGGDPADFAQLETLRAEGETDFLAFLNRFAAEGTIGEMDCVYSHWMTRAPAGFAAADVAALRRLVPTLALAIKCGALARIARTLVEVYLGRDAGQRVLEGRISRGVAEKINAVLWYSDLQGYTAITDTAPPDEIIPLLNDYAEAVITAIHEAGGEVLKLIGDAVLAVFQTGDAGEACRAALRAKRELGRRLRALNERRTAEGRPVTTAYLGLHRGEVFYGNIGSEERLDFTVVGPAVNEVARIAALCRSVDRGVLFSDAFAAATPEPERSKLVSVGRYALRGVGRAQELFTLDPGVG